MIIKIVLLLILLCYVFTNEYISEFLLQAWEIPTSTIEKLDTTYEIGIVLGGGLTINYNHINKTIYGESAHKLLKALELYRKGTISKILITDNKKSLEAKKLLIREGINEKDLLIDSCASSTHENALNTSKIIKTDFPDKNFLLITSSWHMRRAKACFDKESLETTIFCTQSLQQNKKFTLIDLLPSFNGFENWKILFHEIVGYLYYMLRGWI